MLVIDASVAVKAFTQEPGSEAAATLIAEAGETLGPDFITFEVASALAKKVRLVGLPVDQASDALEALSLMLPDRVDTIDLIERATDLSIELNHALFDCFYLALALAHGGTVATSDDKFLASVRGSAHAGRALSIVDALVQLRA